MKYAVYVALNLVLATQAAEHGNLDIEFKKSSILCLSAETMELYAIDADIKKYIGEVSAVQISPCLSWYVLYAFYIKQEYRNKGYGTYLGRYALNRLIVDNHATKIFVQPGPFDADKGTMYNLSGPEREERLQLLFKKYQEAGFCKVNTSFARLVQVIYFLLGINEDAHYLLVYCPKKSAD